MPDSDNRPLAGEAERRARPTARPGPVLALLFLTFAAMLGAIYWVVQSARP
jgi:hypothetical protein